jgi:hypothetical protein
VACIDELFAVDAEGRHTGMDYSAREALREKLARPLLEPLRAQMEALQKSVPPASTLAKR